jgi:hypothetical protein
MQTPMRMRSGPTSRPCGPCGDFHSGSSVALMPSLTSALAMAMRSGERLQFAARLVDGDALLEARDAEHVAVVPVAQHPFLDAVEHGLLHVGNPKVEGGDRHRSVERGRGNADDCELMLVDADGLADNIWIGVRSASASSDR